MPYVGGRFLSCVSWAVAGPLALLQDASFWQALVPAARWGIQPECENPTHTNRQELSVCPLPGSTHPVSLSLLPSSISSLCRAGAASAPAHAVALKKVMCPSWLAQEVGATNTEPSCRFSPCFGAAWLAQETCVLNLPVSAQVCIQSQRAGGLLAACSPWLWRAPTSVPGQDSPTG